MTRNATKILLLATLALTSCTDTTKTKSAPSLLIAVNLEEEGQTASLSVMNTGQKSTGVYRPFFHTTELHFTRPDNSTTDFSDKGTGLDLACLLNPGESTNWYFRLREFITMDQPGDYTVWVTMDGNTSTPIVVNSQSGL